MMGDTVALEDEGCGEGKPLIVPVMRAGKRIHGIHGASALVEARQRALANYHRLSECLMSLDEAPHYPVEISTMLQALAAELDRASSQMGGNSHRHLS